MPPAIRCPDASEAGQISAVMIRSITELCTQDHQGDASVLADWLRNKSPLDVSAWLKGPHSVRVIEAANGTIAAVGMYAETGEVMLLYVDPEHQRQGYSQALLTRIEQEMLAAGITTAHLVSTKTAYPFYLQQGWEQAGAAAACHQTDGIPMQKTLTPAELR